MTHNGPQIKPKDKPENDASSRKSTSDMIKILGNEPKNYQSFRKIKPKMLRISGNNPKMTYIPVNLLKSDPNFRKLIQK